jgi:hypothetical protein
MMHQVSLLLVILILALILVPAHSFSLTTNNNEISSPKDLVTGWLQQQDSSIATSRRKTPLTKTILCVPPHHISNDVVYLQKSTNTRIRSFPRIQSACQHFEDSFQTDLGDVESCIGRISTISPTTVLLQWNVTWVNPSAKWLESLAEAWPGVTPVFCDYTHLSGQRSTFSYKAVGKLFLDAIQTGKFRVPLACIRGITTLEFGSAPTTTADEKTTRILLRSISEDLAYAQDLQRGVLKNRKCAADLRLFLETGRRIVADDTAGNDWDTTVALALPWQTVPGNNPLDVDPQEEGPMAAAVFMVVAIFALVAFAALLAPELIGQSLFSGPPTPTELNSNY